MMKRVGYLAGMLQILMVAAVVGLEILSGNRGGVNHHVLARKHQWSQSILNLERLQQLDIFLGVSALMLSAALIRTWLKPTADTASGRTMTDSLLLALCFTALTFFSYRLPFFQQLRASSYATLTFAAATLLQLGLIAALKHSDSRKID